MRAPAVAGAGARLRLLELTPLLLGFGALVVGTASGWDARVLDAIATPPAIVRLALAGAAVIVAMMLLGAAVGRIEAGSMTGGGTHLVDLLRGVRLAFVAIAALAVAAGWAIGHPLPFVVALIIAGIDVVETSFLLIVVRHDAS